MKIHYSLKNAFYVAAASRIFVFIVAILSNSLLGIRADAGIWESPTPFVNLFSRWDSAYYMQIAAHGYNELHLWAFFPLYPLLMSIFYTILAIDSSLYGFLLSNLFFFLFINYFYKLTAKTFNHKMAFLSTSLVSFFPSSVFFSAVYTESLFVFLIAYSFYSLSEKKSVRSAFAGFFAGLTKPFGFLIGLTNLFDGIINRSIREVVLSLLPLSSIAFFFLFAYLMTGNYFIFFDVQSEYWEVEIVNDMAVFISLLSPFQTALLIFSIILSILTLADLFKHRKWYLRPEGKYYIFFLFLFLFYLNSPLISLSRYTLAFLPVFWYLAKLWLNYRAFGYLLLSSFLILNLYATSLFVNWYYFY